MKGEIRIFMLVLLLSMLTSSSSKKHRYCPGTKFCECQKDVAICKDKNKRLTSIPHLPAHIEELRFKGNNLSNINNETFKILSKLKLRKLSLDDNCIEHITPDAFSTLPFLWKLDLSDNPNIQSTELAASFSSLSKENFELLNINNVGLKELSRDSLRYLTDTKLRTLSMKSNSFSRFNFDILANLTKLNVINLSNNQLMSVEGSVVLSSINNILLKDNQLYGKLLAPVFWANCIFPNLKILHLEANSIVSFENYFSCLTNVTDLFLDQNSVQALQDNLFSHMTKLRKLSLERLGAGLKRIHDHALNVSSLQELSLVGCKLHFASPIFHFNPNKIFKYLPNLISIDVTTNDLNVATSTLILMFKHLKKLKKILVANVKWGSIPNGFFRIFPKLEKIVMTGNSIGKWNGEAAFGGLQNLKSLYMEVNIISVVNESSFPGNILRTLKNISLFDNPFDCSCDLLWFQTFLRTTHIKVLNYPEKYACVGKKKVLVKDAILCVTNPAITVAIALSSVIGFLTILSILIYKSRWHIRYQIYKIRAKNQGYARVPMDEDCLYHGYVVYCDEDREWVHTHMIPAIEEEANMQLCIRLRDFTPGRVNVENVVENMDASRKIVLVLSQKFATDGWCEFQMLLAQTRLIEEGQDALLILLMLEEIDAKHLNKNLHAIITTTPYYIWTEEEVGRKLFWEQVLKALNKPREYTRRPTTEYGSIQ